MARLERRFGKHELHVQPTLHLCAGFFIMLELDPSLSFLSLFAVCTDLTIFCLLNVGLKKKKRINPFALVVYVLSAPVSQFPKFLSW